MRRPHLFSLLVAVLLVGCPKSEPNKEDSKADKKDEDTKKKSKGDDDDDGKSKKKPKGDDDDDGKSKKKKPKGDDDDDGDKPAKKKGDDDDEKPTKKADSLASNEADVTRYPDEKKIDPGEKVKTVANAYNVHASADGKSKTVANLPKDTEVTKIADKAGAWILVVFANPKDKSETLMGWVFRDAFKAAAAAGGGCPAGQVEVAYEDSGMCAKRCTTDADCANAESGPKCVSRSTGTFEHPGPSVKVCFLGP